MSTIRLSWRRRVDGHGDALLQQGAPRELVGGSRCYVAPLTVVRSGAVRRKWTVLIVAFGAGAALVLAVALAAGRLVPAPAPPSELPPSATAALAGAGIELDVARTPAHCVVEYVVIDRGWLSSPALGCPVTAQTARAEAFRQTLLGRAGPASLALASWPDESASVRDRLVWLLVVQGGVRTDNVWACDGDAYRAGSCPAVPATLDLVYVVDAATGRVLKALTVLPSSMT